jgi:hypothetical protein
MVFALQHVSTFRLASAHQKPIDMAPMVTPISTLGVTHTMTMPRYVIVRTDCMQQLQHSAFTPAFKLARTLTLDWPMAPGLQMGKSTEHRQKHKQKVAIEKAQHHDIANTSTCLRMAAHVQLCNLQL